MIILQLVDFNPTITKEPPESTSHQEVLDSKLCIRKSDEFFRIHEYYFEVSYRR